jgi:hypothetical protein
LNWFSKEANDAALAFLAEAGNSAGYVHPFDEPRLWEGHASLVREVHDQMKGQKPDCIVLSVGGGGLMVGGELVYCIVCVCCVFFFFFSFRFFSSSWIAARLVSSAFVSFFV